MITKVSKQVYKSELSLSIIEWGYMDLSYGYDEPDIIRANENIINRIKSMIIPTNPDYYSSHQVKFNNADLVIDDSVPANQLIIGFKAVPDHFIGVKGAIPFTIIEIEG